MDKQYHPCTKWCGRGTSCTAPYGKDMGWMTKGYWKHENYCMAAARYKRLAACPVHGTMYGYKMTCRCQRSAYLCTSGHKYSMIGLQDC